MTDRLTVPASVIEDARAHPEKYRPEVEAGDRVLVVNGTLGSDGLIGTVIAKSVQVTGDPVIGISGGGTTHTVFGWLRVGGVEQGPRPEIGGRVIALSVHLPEDFDAPGMVGTVDFVGYDAIDRLGPLVVFPDPHGIEQRTRVTDWALLPAEDDGMGEATAGRTVGSLNAADRGKSITTDGIPRGGKLVKIEHRSSKTGESRTLLLVHVGGGSTTVDTPSDTPCKVSDGPGEAT